jgi:hypothetical protein
MNRQKLEQEGGFRRGLRLSSWNSTVENPPLVWHQSRGQISEARGAVNVNSGGTLINEAGIYRERWFPPIEVPSVGRENIINSGVGKNHSAT